VNPFSQIPELTDAERAVADTLPIGADPDDTDGAGFDNPARPRRAPARSRRRRRVPVLGLERLRLRPGAQHRRRPAGRDERLGNCCLAVVSRSSPDRARRRFGRQEGRQRGNTDDWEVGHLLNRVDKPANCWTIKSGSGPCKLTRFPGILRPHFGPDRTTEKSWCPRFASGLAIAEAEIPLDYWIL
jgi:hypothetical protein